MPIQDPLPTPIGDPLPPPPPQLPGFPFPVSTVFAESGPSVTAATHNDKVTTFRRFRNSFNQAQASLCRQIERWVSAIEMGIGRGLFQSATIGTVGIFLYVGAVQLDKAVLENEAQNAVRNNFGFMHHNFAGIPFFAPSTFAVTSNQSQGPCNVVSARRVVLSSVGTSVVDDMKERDPSPFLQILRPVDSVQVVGSDCSNRLG